MQEPLPEHGRRIGRIGQDLFDHSVLNFTLGLRICVIKYVFGDHALERLTVTAAEDL